MVGVLRDPMAQEVRSGVVDGRIVSRAKRFDDEKQRTTQGMDGRRGRRNGSSFERDRAPSPQRVFEPSFSSTRSSFFERCSRLARKSIARLGWNCWLQRIEWLRAFVPVSGDRLRVENDGVQLAKSDEQSHQSRSTKTRKRDRLLRHAKDVFLPDP